MFTKTYIVRCSVNLMTEVKNTSALVNAGNRRGALTKFLFHLQEVKDFPHIDPHEPFLSHKTENEKIKLYYNNMHDIKIEVEQINPHDDVIFIGENLYDIKE